MNEALWNGALQCMNGNLLQSWRWGEFKRRQGWAVERLRGESSHGSWMAQVLFRTIGPFSLAYIPRGPVISGCHECVFVEMMRAIDEACSRRRAVSLIMEPSQRFQLKGTYKQHGFVRWLKPFQPTAALSFPVLDDDSLLERMHHKTRYHVRLAARQGATVSYQPASEQPLTEFHRLLTDTAERNDIQLLPLSYFIDLGNAFGDDVEVLQVVLEGQVVASAVMVSYGLEASYLFAASSTEYRGQGVGAYLVFASAQWARERGCTYVDLGNVGNPGLRRFKMGFGGDIHEYPAPMERRYQAIPAWLARTALSARGHL